MLAIASGLKVLKGTGTDVVLLSETKVELIRALSAAIFVPDNKTEYRYSTPKKVRILF